MFLRCTVDTVGYELRLHGFLASDICGRCVFVCVCVHGRKRESLLFRSTLQRRAVHAVHNRYISHTQICCPAFLPRKQTSAPNWTIGVLSVCVNNTQREAKKEKTHFQQGFVKIII